ncbi:MAG: hypothetical protein IMZ66_03425, partial [Planctomycetes bacterium]|nr:hypothetical protein [Planctomycetota bacterium]
MDNHTLERLEFAKVLNRIASGAMLATGAQAARDLRPTADVEALRTRAGRIAEGVAVFEAGHDFAVERFDDPADLLDRAGIEGAALVPVELQTVAAVLRNARDLQAALKRMADTAPTLAKLSWDLAPEPALLAAIDEAIEPDGTVSDDASPDLRRLRRAIAALEQRLRVRLEALLSSA